MYLIMLWEIKYFYMLFKGTISVISNDPPWQCSTHNGTLNFLSNIPLNPCITCINIK